MPVRDSSAIPQPKQARHALSQLLTYQHLSCGDKCNINERRLTPPFNPQRLRLSPSKIFQGDIDHYSIQKQITRRQNKKSPGFVSAVRMIWEATRAEMIARLGDSFDADDNEQDGPGIDKAAFVCLMVKVHYLIICPPVRFRLGRVLVPPR